MPFKNIIHHLVRSYYHRSDHLDAGNWLVCEASTTDSLMESKLSIEGARETDHESGNSVNAHQSQHGTSSVPSSSRCDLMLSPSDILNAIKSSQGAVLDSSDPGCSQLAGSQALLDLGYNVALSTDRMNSSYNGTYATLTPLRPLPPIATVAEKFTRVGGSDSMSYALMQNNNASLSRTSSYEGNMEYSAYKFSKDYEMENNVMESTFEEREQAARSELLRNDERDFSHEQNLSNSYSSYNQCSTSPIKSEQARDSLVRDNSTIMSPYESYANNLISVSLSQKNLESVALMQQALLQEVASSLQPLGQTYHTMREPDQHQQHNLLMAASQCHVRLSPTHDQPSSSTDMQDSQQELDEINTREVALKISNELKKYSIPQAVFAQRVLGRSQGTLSDLLRNPKPWSKLKSGRETFRRMWNWMKEPEYQRMSQLRMSGQFLFHKIMSSRKIRNPLI